VPTPVKGPLCTGRGEWQLRQHTQRTEYGPAHSCRMLDRLTDALVVAGLRPRPAAQARLEASTAPHCHHVCKGWLWQLWRRCAGNH
jgi:hypothetical protein